MTVANLTTSVLYVGNGVTVDFPITFEFKQTKSFVKVFEIVILTGVETEKFETADFTFDSGPITKVVANAAPSALVQWRIERQVPLNQLTNFLNPVDSETLEESVDKLTLIAQEIDARVDTLEIPAAPPVIATNPKIPDWVTATNYEIDQTIFHQSRMYRALTDHLSNVFSTDLLNNEWELIEIEGIAGPQGNVGAPGPVGAGGSMGLTGGAGTNGVNGIFSAIATQGEAEAGVENTKGITSLRTKQAIDFQRPIATFNKILTNETAIAAQLLLIGNLTTRIASLEATTSFALGRFNGSQVLLNSSGPIKLVGSEDEPNGNGAAFRRVSTGTESALVMVQIKRETDAPATRFVTFNLIMQLVNGVWLIGRDNTEQLEATLDLDGVVLTVVTTDVLGTKIGDVFYTTDAMAGANHDTQSEIKWLGQEIPISV